MSFRQHVLDATCTHYQVLRQALSDPASSQQRLLRKILKQNSQSHYGRRHGFANLQGEQDFRHHLPLVRYDDLQQAIDTVAAGQDNVLFDEKILCFETTSGSTNGHKLIPYTASLLKAFQRGVYPWLYDLFRRRPGAASGKAYWSISPLNDRAQHSSGGIPIGLANDMAYFDHELAHCLQQRLAVPAHVATITTVDQWRQSTLRYLLNDETLSLISIWSPTFLTVLMGFAQQLCADRSQAKRYLTQACIKAPALQRERLERVIAALRQNPIDSEALWPHLDTISCWADHTAATPLKALRDMFPHASIQPKGLLATESIITLPLADDGLGAVPALASAYLEFIDEGGQCFSVDQLTLGQVYEVVITTPAGLYRYCLGDRVQVTGRYLASPRLRFVGRTGVISDLCGEKLSGDMVQQCLEQLAIDAMMLPHPTDTAYYLLVDADQAEPELAQRLDQALSVNPHYAHARHLGQLNAIRLLPIVGLQQRFTIAAMRRGQRLGDIKPMPFSADRDWYRELTEDSLQ